MRLRFVCATLLIALTAVLLQARGRTEIVSHGLPLPSFPAQLGDWSGTDRPISQDELDVLGHGDFLRRDYQNQATAQPYAELFIAYFPSQRTGDTIHSPRHCLPGAGWTPVQSRIVTLSLPGHAPFPANRYVFAKGDARDLVLYWYWAHDRGVASEYWAKYYMVRDALQMNRSDGALVRIITPMYQEETADAAEQRVLPFASEISPLLNQYIPR